ncbi:hypothetical protein ACQ4PT_064065 [Festuca glaucescens]
MGSWRKAYGALKDSTRVGLAKVNSDFKDLDIAIVKATNHVECPPKERHVRKIFYATSVSRPRADVAYCIYTLSRRLSKTKNWTVALKTLIVIHRLLREGDPTFKEEFMAYSYRGNILHMANFKDDSSPLAWDCSAWVRTYALFLEERLECFRVLKYDIETERLTKSPQCSTKAHSRTRTLPCLDLMEHLPALQQLLFRLMGCQPEGAACSNYLIQYALALALKESFKIYCAINDGIINLVDMFFDMPKYDAIKALAIYKRAGMQAENLADFYDFCKDLELARTFQFPTLRQNLDEEVDPLVTDLEEHNALALAIVAPGDQNNAPTCLDLFSGSTSGWELALVTAPSSHTSQPIETKLAGGFDKLLLDSLYEDEARRQQIASMTYHGSSGQANPFETNDPFAMSNSFKPPSNVQLAMVTQQQHYFQAQQHQQQYYQPQLQEQYFQAQHHQHQYFQAQQHQHQYFQQQPMSSTHSSGAYNPFGDPFSDLVTLASPKQGNSSLL